MTPKQIQNQIIRQILESEELDDRLLEMFAIEPMQTVEGDAREAYPELDDPDTEDEVYHGVVPFEVQIGILGQNHTIDCRAVYTATLVDDGSIYAIADDVLGECEIEYQMITRAPTFDKAFAAYRDGRPFPPRWESFEPGSLLPWTLRMVVRGLIQEDAIQQQEI